MPESSVVTVLFTDLVGSVELKSRLGDSASDELRRKHFGALRDAIGRHRGREVKTLGDGDMVVFASPSDAVACAVDMQREIGRVARETGEALGLRVGLHLGEVTVEEDDYFGSAVDVARRLCDSATGGQIIASDLVRALVAGRGTFALSKIGPVDLKGVPEPVEAWDVDWRAGDALVPFPAALSRAWWGSYVGRRSERAVVDRAVEDASRGNKRVVLLAGEPGIGKTRLAAEAARSAHSRGAFALFGRCDEGLAAPYQPFVEAFTALARTDAPDVVRAAALAAPELARIVPELAELPSASEGDPLRLFWAVDTFLAMVSAERPVVLVLDDLHWAERSTLLLLRHLARSQTRAALCVIGTYRETELDRRHPLAEVLADLRRERVVERVLLRGLPTEELAALVADRAGHDAPPAFVDAVHVETQGNPFFAEEVLRHLVDSGAVFARDGRWTSDRPVEELGIPEGVREVVGRRLARLDDGANRALQIASVAGAEFDARTIERAGGPSGDELLDALEECVSAGLIAELTTPGRFAFAHALVRQTLYTELSATRRVQLHWRVGEALEAGGASPEVLARHFVEGVLAGDPHRAVEACIVAGLAALDRSAPAEAQQHYETALQTAADSGLTDADQRLRALTSLIVATSQSSDIDRMDSATVEARNVARTMHSGQALARVASARGRTFAPGVIDPELEALVAEALDASGPDRTPERAELLGLSAVYAWVNGRVRDITTELEEARAIAAETGAQAAAFVVRHVEMATMMTSPDVDATLAAANRALEIAPDRFRAGQIETDVRTQQLRKGDRAPLDRWLETIDESAAAGGWAFPANRAFLGGALRLAEGRIGEAKARAAILKPINTSVGFTLAREFLVMCARYQQGSVERAFEPLEAFVGAAPPAFAYSYKAVLASVYLCAGRRADARRILDELATDSFAELPISLPRALAFGRLADVIAMLDARDEAASLLPAIEPYAGQILVGLRGLTIEGAADRALAQLLATCGQLDEAESRYRSAIDLEDRLGFDGWAAWTRYWHARMLAERARPGDATEAEELLDRVLAFTDERGMAYLHRLAGDLAAMA